MRTMSTETHTNGILSPKSPSEDSHDNSTLSEYDPFYEPIVNLPEQPLKTLEEDEDELIRIRAKLFRYDTKETPPEWKERGTGDIKLMHHKDNGTVRVIMRRDKTLKMCANHFVQPWMELKPNCNSDRAFVWSVHADFADEEPKAELLGVRFANSENAKIFKDNFEDSKKLINTDLEEKRDDCKDESPSARCTSNESTDHSVQVDCTSPGKNDDSASPVKKDDSTSPIKKEDSTSPPETKETCVEGDVIKKLESLHVEGNEGVSSDKQDSK